MTQYPKEKRIFLYQNTRVNLREGSDWPCLGQVASLDQWLWPRMMAYSDCTAWVIFLALLRLTASPGPPRTMEEWFLKEKGGS